MSAGNDRAPAKLQQAGQLCGWHTVARFDAHDEEEATAAQEAGALLGRINRRKLRIVVEAPRPMEIARWMPGQGWVPA